MEVQTPSSEFFFLSFLLNAPAQLDGPFPVLGDRLTFFNERSYKRVFARAIFSIVYWETVAVAPLH